MLRIIIEFDSKGITVTNNQNEKALEISKNSQTKQEPANIKPLKLITEEKVKLCPKCGNLFTPKGRQKYCSEECGLVPKSTVEKLRAKQKSKTITPDERAKIDAELDATLKEIEKRRNQPVSLS